jgi:hypothetical protein
LENASMTGTRVLIGPAAPVPLAGQGGAPRIGFAAHDPIEANILVLPVSDGRSVAVVALDALFGSDQLRDAILTSLGDRRALLEDLLLVASHSHSTPVLDPVKPGLGPCDMDHLQSVASRVAGALKQVLTVEESAPRDPAPSRVLWRGRSGCELNVVRRRRTLRITQRAPYFTLATELLPNREVATPHEIDLWICGDTPGQAQWIVWTWPCHATSFFHDTLISADFPGAVREGLREALGRPDLPVLYFPGFCGDIRADIDLAPANWKRRLATPFARPFAEQTPTSYAALCGQLTEAVLQALAGARPAGTLAPGATVRRTCLSFDTLMDSPRAGEVGLARLDSGNLCVLFVGAETCSPYYGLLAPLLPPRALLTGYTDAVPMYLPSDRQVAEGGYEVNGFRGSFGLPGTFYSRIEHKLIEAVRAMSTSAP